MNEPLRVQPASCRQQDKGTSKIGLDNGRGLVNASVHVRFSSEVDDGITAHHRILNDARIADVASPGERKEGGDEVRANEPGTPCDEKLHRTTPSDAARGVSGV